MNVVIVDDEKKVCQLIYHLVDWKVFDMNVVQMLHDGKEAMDYIVTHSPDVVITDIRMPNCDGLEMIERIRKNNSNTEFIIISGYSNFEYAKQAIHYGVEDYLLKPLEKREIEAALGNIMQRKEKSRQSEEEQERLRGMVLNSVEMTKNAFLSDVLYKTIKIPFEHVCTVNETYQTDFVEGQYILLKLQPFFSGAICTAEEMGIALVKLEQMLKERVLGGVHESVFCSAKEGVWCLINGSTLSVDEILGRLRKMRIDVMNLKSIFSNIEVYACIDTNIKDLAKLREAMGMIEITMYNRMLSNAERFLFTDDLHTSDTIETAVTKEDRDGFHKAVELQNLEGISVVIDHVSQELGSREYSGYEIYSTYLELVDIFLHAVAGYKGGYKFPSRDYFIARYNTFLTTEQLWNGFSGILYESLEEYRQLKKEEEVKPIRDAKQYIEDNFSRPISLEEVSNQIGFNPAYFSSLFKKETGKNFLEYVTETRIGKAKRMLATSDRTVLDIAINVGYSEIKYFSKVFKKLTGLSPSEYRRLYS